LAAGVALAPVVTHCVRQKLTILGERGRCERSGELFGGLVFALGVFVPNDDGSVAAVGRKSVVLRVERDAVDCEDIGFGRALRLLSMTLKAKVLVFAQVVLRQVVIFYAAAPLNRADRVPLAVAEHCD